jgi:polyphosphate kinase 2
MNPPPGSGGGHEGPPEYGPDGRMTDKSYDRELFRLQEDLVDLQKWIKHEGLRVAVLFEGRDAAGKGGVIKRITQRLNHRIARVVAPGIPTERERSQWYFQRYVPHLPAAGEMVLFDRSWYNRAGVEKVMGFCTDAEYREFLRSCPEFERMLVQSGMILIKYWFAISPKEQERRFRSRMEDPRKRWKIGPIDVASRAHWIDYSRARDEMFRHTDTDEAPWYAVGSRREAPRPPELYPSSSADDSLPGDSGRTRRSARSPEGCRLPAPPDRDFALGPRSLWPGRHGFGGRGWGGFLNLVAEERERRWHGSCYVLRP